MSISLDSEVEIGQNTELANPIKFGTVDLDVEGEIDIHKFGDAISNLLPTPKIAFMGSTPETESKLKFIVAQSAPENKDDKPQTRMYIFDKDTLHADLYKQLLLAGGSYTLLSAGYLDLTLGERNVISSGNLSQYSDSLEQDFQLDKARSDEYKTGRLVQKLGRRFSAK